MKVSSNSKKQVHYKNNKERKNSKRYTISWLEFRSYLIMHFELYFKVVFKVYTDCKDIKMILRCFHDITEHGTPMANKQSKPLDHVWFGVV
jgi:hypothetical protein